jgi:hypothetical protein
MAGMKRTAAVAAALAIAATPVARAEEFVPGVTDFGRGGAQAGGFVPGVTDFPRTGGGTRDVPAFPASSGGDGIVGDEALAAGGVAALAAALALSGLALRRRRTARA